MNIPTQEELLKSGSHFGHLTRRWNPSIAPYIFAKYQSIHIININKTRKHLEEACHVARKLAASGKRIMFIGTKKQAKSTLSQKAKDINMPYVTERWLGGMLTNFSTIKKSIKKLDNLERLIESKVSQNFSKKELLMKTRERDKLKKILEGISKENMLPSVLFVVDIVREKIAVQEAQKLNIPIIAIVDTNANPNKVKYPIPANDDSYQSISLITTTIASFIGEGLEERKNQQEKEKKQVIQQKIDSTDNKPEKHTGRKPLPYKKRITNTSSIKKSDTKTSHP